MQPLLVDEISATLPLNLRTGAAQIHRGITIIPIFAATPARADYITLGSAQPLGFTIDEVDAAGHVPELLVHNPLDTQVMLYDGEEVVGAKQNRMLEATILVAARSTQKIPVACVEAGRWLRISNDFTASDRVSHPESRRRKSYDLESAPLSLGMSQGTVWDEIEERIEERSLDSNTRALADVHDVERPRIDALEATFPLVAHQCGAILALDGTLCLDYVSRCDAWEALWPKIRRGYLLDGLRHIDDLPTSPELIARFVENVCHAPRTERPSPGLGLDQRLHGATVTGSGLVLDDELLQLSAFSRTGQSDHPAFGDVILTTHDTRITQPSRRHH
jgi:hypothetical protein